MSKEEHITSIGGSAVMEGVMMRGPKEIATAVRKPDGEIEILQWTSPAILISLTLLQKEESII